MYDLKTFGSEKDKKNNVFYDGSSGEDLYLAPVYRSFRTERCGEQKAIESERSL